LPLRKPGAFFKGGVVRFWYLTLLTFYIGFLGFVFSLIHDYPPIPNTPTTKKIRVMVIDTGIDGSLKEFKPYLYESNLKLDLEDQHGHGTHVTSLILFGRDLKDPVCDDVEIVSCRYTNLRSVSQCVRLASKLKINIINFSGGGKEYDPLEHDLLAKFEGVSVVAAGNRGSNLNESPFYPASLDLPNLIAVANGTSEQDRSPTSNFGLAKLVWVDGRDVKGLAPGGGFKTMTGTSQSAALYTHRLLKRTCYSLSK
jgi:subtilisin family serine protease